MIQTFSSTIRRKEMDAVLTCMVDEKIGPGEINKKFIQMVMDFFSCSGAVALRSPSVALKYATKAIGLEEGSKIMISALSPSWYFFTLKELKYEPMVLDVDEKTGLISLDCIKNAVKNGGRLLIFHETMGILPDWDEVLSLGIPIIEDISQSAGAVYYSDTSSDMENETEDVVEGKKAGLFGIYSIMGLEEHNIITGGGGAVLLAPERREWSVLKKYTDTCPDVDILPDLNSALASVQIKEFKRNESRRKEIYAVYQHSLLSSRHKTFIRALEDGSSIWSFPVILSSNLGAVKKYTSGKGIAISSAYENTVINILPEETTIECKIAKSLLLRCVLFPLYPRLGNTSVSKIAKIIGTLP